MLHLWSSITHLASHLATYLATPSQAQPHWRAPLAISLGAVPGALSRYYLGLLCTIWFGTGFPVGTFLINLSGAFLMGLFVTFVLERAIGSADLRLFVTVGFLGSYTTFSTYALDTVGLWRTNQKLALLYGIGSAVLGVICLEVGAWLARRL